VAQERHPGAFEIAEAQDALAIEACRALFVEYQQGLGVSLCFQDFDQELAALPGSYARPRGRLFLVHVAGEPAACAALRPLGDHDAEMKRLYVRSKFRGMGIGAALARRVIDDARAMRYVSLKLDTLPSMHEAQALYARLGFVDVPPYNDNPIRGTRFMSLDLTQGA
jgi:ribosomal protein S18 acetylase RimI-like enzyme